MEGEIVARVERRRMWSAAEKAAMLAAIAPGYWFFAGALVVIGVAALTLTNTTNSLMQLSTEPAMRGRVMALRVGIALGGTPIGAPIGQIGRTGSAAKRRVRIVLRSMPCGKQRSGRGARNGLGPP